MNIPLNIDWQQILLHLFNFVILFAILYFLLYNPVKKFMAEREAYYKDMDDKAKAELKNAEEMKSEYAKKIDLAEDEISQMKEKALKDADAAVQLKIEQSQIEADKLIKDAKASIDREHKKMVADAKNEISDIVTNAVEKIVSSANTTEAYDEFLNIVKRGNSNE